MAKRKYWTFSDVCFDSIFTKPLTTGYDSSIYRYDYKVDSGIPKGAVLVDLKLRQYPINTVEMVFEHESFEDVDDIYSQPPMTVTVTQRTKK